MPNLMERKVDFTPVKDKTIKEVFGTSCKVKDMSKKLWALIKDPKQPLSVE